MALILDKIYNGYTFFFNDIADPRMKDYFLISSPIPLFAILVFYLYFVLKLGPKLMQNRAPFDLEKILIVYNIIQIIACAHIVIECLRYTVFSYSWICEPIDYSDAEIPVYIAKVCWVYFLIKLADLLDTVFFVLRKKDNQVSFLHVYHHTGMCVLGWGGAKYLGGGHGVLIGFINCIIHIVMYFYYLLAAWDKEHKKNIWWKKHITQMQILQFGFFMVYFGQTLFNPDCGYPKWIAMVFVPQNIFMIILFTNFYIKTYIKPAKESITTNNLNKSK